MNTLQAYSEFLVSLMKKASEEYHNKGTYLKIDDETVEILTDTFFIPSSFLAGQHITDPFYDCLELELKRLDPTNPFLKSVGAPVIKQKAKLPIQMSGLEKMTVNDGTVQAFNVEVPGPYLSSDKLDGVSIQVEYLNDSIKAYTRGDGMIGEDISYLVPHLKLPKTSPYKNIRGEIIMQKQVFNDKWAEEYENPRNLVAGKVNAKDVHPAIHDMDVVIYGVLSDSSEKPSVQLQKLQGAGFNVVKHSLLENINDEILSKLLADSKAKSEYELDGIVVVADRLGLKHTVDNPSWGRKFKENTDFYEVEVLSVEYDPSKDGYLKPTLTIVPTRMGGVTVKRATAFNHLFVVENGLGVGAKILITRSGDVIPHIVEIITPAEELFYPSEPWVWNKTGVDAVVEDPDNHPIVKLKRITSFFRTLKIDELGESSFDKVIDAGFDTFDKIIKMSQAEWKSVDGFAGKRGEIAFTEMQKCMSNVYLPSLADATGFFGRGFGTTRFEAVIAAWPDIINMNLNMSLAYELAVNVNGIGPTTAKQFADGIVQFIPWLKSMENYITLVEPEKTEVLGNIFEGQGVTFTGFRNADWQAIVEHQGGQSVDFGKKTTILVFGGKKSTKVAKAEEKGIKTMTQGEFLEILTQNKLV